MWFLIFFFVIIPYIIFILPLFFCMSLVIFILRKSKIGMTVSLIWFISFLWMDVSDYFLAQKTIDFRKNICEGEKLYTLSENAEYLSLIREKPNFILAIPRKYCNEQCEKNLGTKKDALRFQIIENSDTSLVLPSHKTEVNSKDFLLPSYKGGMVINLDVEGKNAMQVYIDQSSNDETQTCQAGYMCFNGFESSVDISEFKEVIFANIFDVKKSFSCE